MQPTRATNILLVTILAVALAAPLCCLVASTSHGALFEFTIKDEKELGKKFNTAVRSRLPIIEDPEIKEYVQDLGARVVAVIPPQPWPVEVNMVRSNMLNAFAGPAGYVFLFSGLILEFEHESDLAGVLAHELAHVTQRHLADRIEKSQIVGPAAMIGLLAGAFLGGGGNTKSALAIGSMAAGQSAMLSFTRENERDADQIGLGYLIKAGFNPWGLVRGFKVMRKKQYFLGRDIPSYLSTHPGLDERIDYMASRVEQLPPDVRDRPEHDERFQRVKTLIRSRFTDTTLAMGYYNQLEPGKWSCLDYMGYAILLDRMNRKAEAGQQFEKALSCAPSDPLVVREAGSFYFQMGAFDRSSALLQKAVMLNPKDLMTYFFYARLLGEKKDYPQAIDYMERVRKKVPEDPEIRYYLGRFYGESGDPFQGHLQLAYASLFKNEQKPADFQRKQAARFATTEEQKKALEEFESAYNERAEFW